MKNKVLSPEEIVKRVKERQKIKKYKTPEEIDAELKSFQMLNNALLNITQVTLKNSVSIRIKEQVEQTFNISRAIKDSLRKHQEKFIAIKKSLNVFSNIDWDKVNAYKLIEELEKNNIDPMIIGKIDIEELASLTRETEKMNLSLVQVIKESANFEDKLDYEMLSKILLDIKTEIKSMKRRDMVLRIAKEHYTKSTKENKKTVLKFFRDTKEFKLDRQDLLLEPEEANLLIQVCSNPNNIKKPVSSKIRALKTKINKKAHKIVGFNIIQDRTYKLDSDISCRGIDY